MKYPTPNSFIIECANRFNDKPTSNKNSPFWSNFISSGTNLWIDTGDIDAAQLAWCNEFSALTTNNTLLNQEVQKGTYDDLLPALSKKNNWQTGDEKVKEIAFCINAIHGLRLAKRFNCKISVELHTDLAHNIEGMLESAMRLHSICPKNFIIKIPFTAAGLIGARKLKHKGVPVNMTLGFSVRHNSFAAHVAQASYSNVFIGRLSAYFVNNELNNGINISEKVMLETQQCMRSMNKNTSANTKIIAASIRSANQLLHIVGTDVITIPPAILNEAIKNQVIPSKSTMGNIPDHGLPFDLAKKLNIKHLWQVKNHEKETILHLSNKLPTTSKELEEYASDHGCCDIFPKLNANELETLRNDGKIPVHKKWEEKISTYQIGIDTLLNTAGLFAFMKDQHKLDSRIQSII